ncbi:nuclear transport factor 2 family protein [Novosphingobium sp.]|uniref:nuclear transport factor 2 family protein n=1 Tax=Novosphingobium sp. TaxID=1874826 RepID=UPI001ED2B2BD|nr:nuclear transport factor 2 family protein [Novosphingobium sp.]MBK6802341.1 nuclear transport factor 2 family protein [Novosphingobium sp.]MBK9009601.1 nuclear transport factor 2 family protein [Novosphingobium sp.]
MTTLEARIDRLESLDAIRQLPAKYALALDMRDMDAMVSLFPADVRVGKDASGRQALRAYMDRTLRSPFTGTSHHIGGHVIEFDDPDHAHGIVYSKNEHETGDEWVIMQMMYSDDYVRVDGRWYFARRLPLYWYATDLNKPPIGDAKMRWPGTEWSEGNFHKLFPSFAEFWARTGDHGGPVAEPAPLEKFLETMRRGAAAPKVKVRAD